MDKVRKVFFITTKYVLLFTISILLFVFVIDKIISLSARKNIYKDINEIPSAYTILVPGAMVWSSGKLSGVLEDRMNTAYSLYKAGKVKRFLLSGDHGNRYYDEVNSMKKFLLKKGVNKQDIFLDHAGFDTYSSIVRAKEVFNVNELIIVTQKFHLSRAVFIAKCKKIKVYGMSADQRPYKEIKYLKFREKLANIKAVYEIVINRTPEFLGDSIPITGDSSVTYNK